MTYFQYHPQVLNAYPQLAAGVIVGRGLRGGTSPEALQLAFIEEQQKVIKRIGSTPLSELPSLAAWRAAFRAFGVDPTQYRSAAEALLRRLTKKGDIPSINTLVDVGNLVSIRYGLPIAILDRRYIQGAITVHHADGTEPFTNLNAAEIEYPAPGEVIFSDVGKKVHARRWCWRQSDESAARDDTSDILITIEAHHAAGVRDVQSAVEDLLRLLGQYAGGDCVWAALGSDNPAI
jgi:DNA/RNA-binding domain of Phe-tRNA-synthetase-like protein